MGRFTSTAEGAKCQEKELQLYSICKATLRASEQDRDRASHDSMKETYRRPRRGVKGGGEESTMS